MKNSIKTILAVIALGFSTAFLGTACVHHVPHHDDVDATQTTTRETVTTPGVYGVPATSSTTTTTTRAY